MENRRKHRQELANRKHREQKELENLMRRSKLTLDRPEPEREEMPLILIVCEGENTEPSYFRNFKVKSAKIKIVGEGFNTISLVDRAYRLSKEHHYDQVWCVFDKDDFKEDEFNHAITIASEIANFKVAYSNQAFEYWLILHFENHQGGRMHRHSYKRKLDGYLHHFRLKYPSNKLISPELFDVLISMDYREMKKRFRLAIERAKRNNEKHLVSGRQPARQESNTLVYMLVEELLKYSDIRD